MSQPVIVPRWEWRAFDRRFAVAEPRFAALESTGVQESEELYLVARNERTNVKVRADLMDIKVLKEVNADGLEQWTPVMKVGFPLTQTDVRRVFEALRRPSPGLARDSYTLDQFTTELVGPSEGLRMVPVHKRRVRYVIGGCTSEVSDVTVDGKEIRTIAIEKEDAAAVIAAVRSVGLGDYVNTSYPRGVVMTKHAPFIATEKTVAAHEDPAGDGRCRSKDTGYQANLRYGAQQSCTRNWLMPMHQTDTLFHKAKAFMAFIFGGEADNHAVNTVPKETLVRVTKAEDGGMGGQGVWAPATTGYTPDNESEFMRRYLNGDLIKSEET